LDRAWQILRDAGVPLASSRGSARPTPAEIRAAVSAVIAAAVGPCEGEALGAFLLAWRQAWPSSFAETFASAGPSVEAWARRQLPDEDRYLKLRRIAIANRSTLL
jgi:hypothetical protein